MKLVHIFLSGGDFHLVSGTGRFFRGSEVFGFLGGVVIVRGVWRGEDGGLIMVGSSRMVDSYGTAGVLGLW